MTVTITGAVNNQQKEHWGQQKWWTWRRGGVAGIVPSLPRKVRKTSHQHQINRQIKQKPNAIFNQAQASMTTLVAKKRSKKKENQCMATQVIKQVKGEFRVRGFGVTLRT